MKEEEREHDVPVPGEIEKQDNEPKYPFLWAKEFPLEKVCICEMGAKKIDLSNSSEPVSDAHVDLAERLGEQYRVVTERSLVFS